MRFTACFSWAILAIFLLAVSTALCQGADQDDDMDETHDAGYWLAQTESDYNQGSYSQALDDIDEYLNYNSTDVWAWSFRANLLVKMKRYSDAVDSFDQLIRLDSSNAQAYNDRALVLSGGLRQSDEALESIGAALQLDPKSASTWFNKGVILEEMEMYDEALLAYNQSSKLDGSHDKTWYRQGLVLARMGDYEQAAAMLDRAIKINDRNADAWNVMGLIYREQSLMEEAKGCFEKAVAIEPDSAEFKRNLDEVAEATAYGTNDSADDREIDTGEIDASATNSINYTENNLSAEVNAAL